MDSEVKRNCYLSKRQTAGPDCVHWWLSHQRPVKMELHFQVRYDRHPGQQCSLLAAGQRRWREVVTHALLSSAWTGGNQTTHAVILTHRLSLSQMVDGEAQPGMCQWSTVTFQDSGGCTALGSGDSSAVRAPDSWLKGRGFEFLQERRENFLLQGQLSLLTLTSVSIPPPCSRSCT